MKKVTDYVKVGELCESPDGSVLKCVSDGHSVFDYCACEKCWYRLKPCSLISCAPLHREDGNHVRFEKVEQ